MRIIHITGDMGDPVACFPMKAAYGIAMEWFRGASQRIAIRNDQGGNRAMHGNEYLDLALMLFVGLVFAKLAQKIGQTAMVGRMTGGIVLGTLLIALRSYDPKLIESYFSPEFEKWLTLVAGFGLTLYQGSCGTHIKKHARDGGNANRTYWACMVAGIAAPLAGGFLLGMALYADYAQPGIPRIVFCGVMGLCFALTSIVGISLSLNEFRLKGSRIGSIALKCATTEDALAWVFLSIFLAFLPTVVSHSPTESVIYTLGFLAVMWIPVRWLLATFMPRDLNNYMVYGIYFCLLMLIAGVSEHLGLHALFGAMLLGMIVPRENDFAHRFEEKIQWPIEELFVPLFLIYSGMQCDFRGFNLGMVGTAALIIVIATATKLVACAFAARYIGNQGWRESFVIGIAMNTRGLMTLMLLKIAKDYGIFTTEMYTMMLVMAVITTAMTSWGLHLTKASTVAEKERRAEAPDEATDRILVTT